MPGMREKVEAIANPLPKKSVAIASGDPTPPDLLIPMLTPQSATFRIIELGPLRKLRNYKRKSNLPHPCVFPMNDGSRMRNARLMSASKSGGPILSIVGRKGKPSVSIDRLTGYVDCILRSQESKDAGNFLSARRFS